MGGCVLVLGGLFLSLLVVAMFAHPGGINAEWLLGPIFGFFALVMLFGGAACIYVGFHIKVEVGTP